ncbi:hypothetical protein AWM68_04540 [Fictibacillus phosphorivorans]|uniref:Translocation protein TolB n=2 Tax=Fictibacillus phosphorivorans TaxID=1221500 RepID=A0A165NPU3_9BACL|nr:hypothetical protein AWM68_04540 [Fictibacillus phosphorivorans]
MRCIFITLSLILVMINHPQLIEAADDKAAFVREDGLWLKEGELERRIVEGSSVSHPRFSSNGTYISYVSGNHNELWVYNRVTRLKRKVFDGEVSLTNWSPVDSKLAWKSSSVLNVIDLSKPATSFQNVILGAGNYSWAPNGKGFVVSSSANLEPDGWSPVRLFYVPVNANGDLKKVENITTLPKMSQTFFAIGTTEFKWGSDDQWFAFIACPTASMSADSNTLMVVSLDGSRTKMIGNMLDQPNWFHWSPNKKKLAFIKGIGRLISENKRLTVWDAKSNKETNFGFPGYADGDFTWRSDKEMIVSRQIEWGWDVPEEKRSKPFLASVNVSNGSSTKLTKPGIGEADVYPKTLLNGNFVWIRTGMNPTEAKVMIKRNEAEKEKVWIEKLRTPDNCSGWACMIDIYQAR